MSGEHEVLPTPGLIFVNNYICPLTRVAFSDEDPNGDSVGSSLLGRWLSFNLWPMMSKPFVSRL